MLRDGNTSAKISTYRQNYRQLPSDVNGADRMDLDYIVRMDGLTKRVCEGFLDFFGRPRMVIEWAVQGLNL